MILIQNKREFRHLDNSAVITSYFTTFAALMQMKLSIIFEKIFQPIVNYQVEMQTLCLPKYVPTSMPMYIIMNGAITRLKEPATNFLLQCKYIGM